MKDAISVICAVCGTSGTTADPAFAELHELLGFTPVPRLVMRDDGWSAERQRAFIAALAIGGSVNKAARSIGREPGGAGHLRRHAQGAEFAAAWDKALEIARDRTHARERAGVEDLAVRELQRIGRPSAGPAPKSTRPGVPLPSSDPDSAATRRTLLDQLLARYAVKLRQERAARRAGRLTEADFTLRQLTFLEVALDLASPDLFAELARLERGGHALLDIADTWASRLLLAERRKAWAEAGDPATPDPWPDQALADHPGHRTEPPEHAHGADREQLAAQEAAFRQAHRAAAADLSRSLPES